MKTKTFFITMICTILMLANMQAFAQDKKEKKDANKETIELSVPTMHCKNCQKKIEKNISYEKGITDLEVDLENKTVKVTYKKDQTNLEKIQLAFEKLGYKTEIVENNSK
ncbi:MAG: heavy-metal-associated domain-containing protein [Bacteroidales bacterium]|nr:heavy-metal-associated domain-containing protein [Bacteroidales bacterium]